MERFRTLRGRLQSAGASTRTVRESSASVCIGRRAADRPYRCQCGGASAPSSSRPCLAWSWTRRRNCTTRRRGSGGTSLAPLRPCWRPATILPFSGCSRSEIPAAVSFDRSSSLQGRRPKKCAHVVCWTLAIGFGPESEKIAAVG